MNERFLLKTDRAERLYRDYAKELPIIDYHNHLSVKDIAENKKYDNLYELWLASDPYKHRLMRISGISENFITGDATPFEKFEKYCEVFPSLAGNPVFDWSKMELSSVFGINDIPCLENAKYIYDKCGEMLKSSEFGNNGILSRFNIEYSSPVASLLDDLRLFDGVKTAPSLRGDNLLAPTLDFTRALESRSGVKISDDTSYITAVSVLLDEFADKGCKFADHALDAGFLDSEEKGKKLLALLGVEYAKRGWTLLLHLEASRKTSTRLGKIAGPAGGYAASGSGVNVPALTSLLDEMETREGLPDTVLFSLNMSDVPALSILQGSFSEDGTPSKVQLGPAWWWCDHSLGITTTLSCISSFGVLSRFIGMTTDSRSILSLVRHDYFRRIFCSHLDRLCYDGDFGLSDEQLGETVRRVCYENAKEKIERRKI